MSSSLQKDDFILPPEIERMIEAAAEKEEIYEPKYGGKDRSGHDTLMLYEVNGERYECFEKGAKFGYHLRDSEVQTLKIELEFRQKMIEGLNKVLYRKRPNTEY